MVPSGWTRRSYRGLESPNASLPCTGCKQCNRRWCSARRMLEKSKLSLLKKKTPTVATNFSGIGKDKREYLGRIEDIRKDQKAKK